MDVRISGLVVTFNEARRLSQCLQGLGFCDELVVVDLGSSDESVAIAERAGARVQHMAREPFVEAIWPRAAELTQHPWIVIADPDEVMPEGLGAVLLRRIAQLPELGMLSLPHVYHVAGRPLRGTRWGGSRPKPFVFRREAVDFVPVLHAGRQLRAGYAHVTLDAREAGFVRHYWIDGVGELFEKHRRYLQQEGASRRAHGERFSLAHAARVIARGVYRDLLHPRARRDGLTGLALGAFSVGYEAACQLALRRHERAG